MVSVCISRSLNLYKQTRHIFTKMVLFFIPRRSGITTSSETKPSSTQRSLLSFLEILRFQFGCIVFALGYILTLSIIVLPLEVICFLLVRPWSLWVYRKINSVLHLCLCSHLIVLAEWWSNTKIQIFVDPLDLELIKKEHSILLVNHRCATEQLVIGSLVNYLGMLGNLRTFMKKSLSYMPVLGWVWRLQENILLERDFQKDQVKLGNQLTSLLRHSDPFTFTFFPEGTRFTKEKHNTSMKIAREKGLPELKHHLLPRTKGFVTFMQNLIKINENKKQLSVSIVDALVSIQVEGSKASSWTFSEALKGKGADVKIVLRRYRIPDILFENNNDKESLAMWLQKRYQEKDRMMQNFENSSDRNFFSNVEEALSGFLLPKSWKGVGFNDSSGFIPTFTNN